MSGDPPKPEWRVSPHDGRPHAFRIMRQVGVALCSRELCSHDAPASQLGKPLSEKEALKHYACVPCGFRLAELRADHREDAPP